MEREKKKSAMIAGMVSMAVFMIGDWFLDVKGSGNEEIGIFVNSNWTSMSMWRFEVSILLAAAFESMGHLLMFLAAFLFLQNNVFQKK